MATLYSNKMTTATIAQPRATLGLCSVTAQFNLAAALAVNDLIQMMNLPTGATVVDGYMSATDLDTGGTAIRLQLGDTGVADRYIAATDCGTAATFTRISKTPSISGGLNVAGVPYKITGTDDNIVIVKVSTGPTTGATSGSIIVTLLYTMDA